MVGHFQTLARYNRIVNERLYSACAEISDEEFRRERFGSFGSIHHTLNHILVADRIWMGRFECRGEIPASPSTILHYDLPSLREARVSEDTRIEGFISRLTDDALRAHFSYRNTTGQPFEDPLHVLVGHMFNHQTHHRGQIHVMLSQTGLKPLSLDMHRIINPLPPL